MALAAKPLPVEVAASTPMLMHSVFDWRTGYLVVSHPAGHFNKHPEGEGDPRRFVIVEHLSTELPPQKAEVEYPSEDGKELLTETRPIAKLDFDAFLKAAPLRENAKLDNVFSLPTSKEAAESIFVAGDKLDFLARTKTFDTRKNAALLVGTVETYATVSAAITASSSGDYIGVRATAGFEYNEQINDGGKWLTIRNEVGTKGTRIYHSSSPVVTLSGVTTSFENFVVGKSGTTVTAGVSLTAGAGVKNVRCEYCGTGLTAASGSPSIRNCEFVNNTAYGARVTANIGLLFVLCTAANNGTSGFSSSSGASTGVRCIGCLAADNGTDFVNQRADLSALCVSEDASAVGTGSVTGFDPSDFTTPGSDYTLKASVRATTKALFYGTPTFDVDTKFQKRRTTGTFYAGAHEPYLPAPTTLAAADRGDGGGVDFTWDAGLATETIRIYGATGGAYSYLGSFKADAAGGILGGLTVGTAYTFKAVFTSEGVIEGTYTAATGAVTPTLSAANAAYAALEGTRNSKTAAAGDIRTGKSVTIAAVATNGSLTVPTTSQILDTAGGNVHLPEAAEVEKFAAFGPSSGSEGTLYGRGAYKARAVIDPTAAPPIVALAKAAGTAGNALRIHWVDTAGGGT